MRFLREHLFYVVLIVLTVFVGGGAMAYYFTSDIGNKVKLRQKVSSQLNTLAKRPQKINKKAVKDLQDRNESYKAASKKASADSVAFNSKNLKVLPLNVGGADPKPAFPILDARAFSDKGLFFEFIRQYNRSMDELVSMNRKDLCRTVLPTREEIDEQQKRLKEQWQEQAPIKAVEFMKVRKAREGRVYIEEAGAERRDGAHALDWYFAAGRTSAATFELWESQVNLWVTQEVLQAIAATNQDLFDWRKKEKIGPAEESVLTSAVKRLERINVTESFVPAQRATGGGPAAPSLGARGTNDEYGVIRYQFSVIMPPRHVERLLRTLMVQNYHTALLTQMTEIPPRDRGEYYYGAEPVMRAEIEGEMLLLLEWALPLMPEDQKARLTQAKTGA